MENQKKVTEKSWIVVCQICGNQTLVCATYSLLVDIAIKKRGPCWPLLSQTPGAFSYHSGEIILRSGQD